MFSETTRIALIIIAQEMPDHDCSDLSIAYRLSVFDALLHKVCELLCPFKLLREDSSFVTRYENRGCCSSKPLAEKIVTTNEFHKSLCSNFLLGFLNQGGPNAFSCRVASHRKHWKNRNASGYQAHGVIHAATTNQLLPLNHVFLPNPQFVLDVKQILCNSASDGENGANTDRIIVH